MLLYQLEIRSGSVFVKLTSQSNPSSPGSRRILYLDTLKKEASKQASAHKPDVTLLMNRGKGGSVSGSLPQGYEHLPKQDLSDLAAVEFLIKLHLRANSGRSIETLSFQEIALPPASAAAAIRLMAKTSRLFFRGRALEAAAKPQSLFWKGEHHPDRSATLHAFLADSPLERAEHLQPGWAIVNGQWMEIETDIAWKWIDLFRNGPVVLDGVQKKRFLEENPRILWKEVSSVALRVLPILVLTDATGSFANLMMDYPGIGRVAWDDLSPNIGVHTRLKSDEISWEKDLLEAGFQRKGVASSSYYCPSEKARGVLQLLLEVGWRIEAAGKSVVRQTGAQLTLSERGSDFALAGHIQFQERQASLRATYGAIERGRLFVELDSASIGLLDAQALPPLPGKELLFATDSAPCLIIAKHRLGEIAPLLDRDEITWDVSLREAVKSLQEKEGFAPVVLDHQFQGTLFPYQQRGVEWLSFLQRNGLGALLSDEMGLGKTVQVLAFFSQLRTNLPILIVAPTSLLFNWQSEIARFWPSAKVTVHTGPNRGTLDDKSVILTSYAILRADQAIFSSLSFEVLVLDESQAIKSKSSLAALAACRLQAKFRIAVTGTPIENKSDELWSQFRFLMPHLLGDQATFSATSPEIVRRRVKPFILKRTKEEVALQLPEKIDRPLWIEMTETQRVKYEEMLRAFQSGLLQKIRLEGIQAHRMQAFEAILRLRQIACDPRLVDAEAIDAGAKAEMLLSMAEEWVSLHKKTLVFSQFATWLRLLERDLHNAGIETLFLDGTTPESERGALVQKFQQEDRPYLFLLSLKAGGVGLNLTAAQNVVLLDPWWNESVERQAIDRAHRIGQKNTLLVYRFLAPHTIEEKMLRIKDRKVSEAAAFLDENSECSVEDLLMELQT